MIDPAKTDPPQPESEGAGATEPKKELTADEQMAQFEEDLKETDWGHQPC